MNTNNENDKRLIFDAAIKTLECDTWDPLVYTRYALGQLSDEKRHEFVKHLEGCSYCKFKLAETQAWVESTQRKIEGDKTAAAASIEKKLAHINRLYHEKTGCGETITALAADATEFLNGNAYGVAVDRHGSGAILECEALVGKEPVSRPSFEINGIQCVGDESLRITPPLDELKQLLTDLFRSHPALKPFQLHRRDLSVHVRMQRDLFAIREPYSLALSIIVAILNALTRRTHGGSLVISAQVSMDGALEKVESVHHKLAVVKKHQAKELLVSSQNRRDFEALKDAAGGINILYLDTLSEVINHFGYKKLIDQLPKANPCEIILHAGGARRLDTQKERVTGWEFIATAARKRGVSEEFIVYLRDLAMVLINNPVNTTLIIGMPDRVVDLLPESAIDIKQHIDIRTLLESIHSECLPLFDGRHSAFIFSPDGCMHSLRRLECGIEVENRKELFLQPDDQRLGLISRVTDAIVFRILADRNEIRVFDDGELIGRYWAGKWKPVDFIRLKNEVISAAEKKDMPSDIANQICRLAIRLADMNKRAIFVVFNNEEKIKPITVDVMNTTGIGLTVSSIRDFTDEELIRLAGLDGAVVLDQAGRLHAAMVSLYYSRLDGLRVLAHGAREPDLRMFSKEAECLCVSVSKSGLITLYLDGERVYRA